MLVNLMPGADRQAALTTLQTLKIGAENGLSRVGDTVPAAAYLDWATNAARTLRHVVQPADVDRLVCTPRYWVIQQQAVSGSGIDISGALRPLLGLELEERITVFSEAHTDLDRLIRRWDRNGHFVVADTSVFIESAKIEELDFVGLVEFRGAPVHLLIPIVVIDELDGLKRYGVGEHRGWRARYTLAVIDRVLENPTSIARLRKEDFSPLDSGGIPRGEITVEILFDPPGHERLSILDDEIVSRALAAQAMAGRAVTVMTHDTGQATRARAAGLTTVKVPSPAGAVEPARK